MSEQKNKIETTTHRKYGVRGDLKRLEKEISEVGLYSPEPDAPFKAVRIKLESATLLADNDDDILAIPANISMEFDGAVPENDPNVPSEDDRIRLTTDGRLYDLGDRIELSYDESEMLDMGGTTTKIVFEKAAPGVVTMLREGGMNMAMQFNEANPRYICAYDTGIIPIEFCIFTKNVENQLGENGGTLRLDYFIEVHGKKLERNCVMLSVTPAERSNGEE